MRKRRAVKVAVLAVLVMLLTALNAPIAGAFGRSGTPKTVNVSQTNMPRLTSGEYAAWASVNGKNVLLGEFTVNSNGKIVGLNGKELGSFTTSQDLTNTTEVFVTVEKSKLNGRGPSNTRILQGSVSNNSASLKFPVDFSNASGTVVLAIMSKPIDGNMVPLTNGAWFVKMSGNKAGKGLNIPNAPGGWQYGGWASKNNMMPLRIGMFTSPTQADNFNGFGSALSQPDFPGQNFLQNAPNGYTFPLNLQGSIIWVTLEPNPGTGQSPFPLVLFKKNIPGNQGAGRNIGMGNNWNNFPTMKVTIK
ncbi:MAG: hypothetical protein M1335_00115 [Chloroflexi bacterium]|nr:hypothetical protein [Chloroflexota bacterium]